VAQAPGGAVTVVARIPTECARADIAVARDGVVYLLPQVPNAAALHTMPAGTDLLVSTRGLGVLVFDGFVPAATAGAPPHLVLADGTSFSASEVLARPAETVSLAACQPGAGVAGALAQLVPAGGDVAQAAPPADPAAGVQDGGRFDSVFSGSTFESLSYGDVSSLGFGRVAGPLGGRGLLRTTSVIIDLLGLGTDEAEAFIPFSDKPHYAPTGAAIDTDALIANEGISVYLSGLAGIVGAPDPRNLTVAADPFLVVTLEHEGTAYSNLVGFYKMDAHGTVTDVDVLWLNARLDGSSVAPDFFGQVADRTLTVFVPPETQLGFFLIADGGGNGSLTGTGLANLALFKDLLVDLGIDPKQSWQGNLDAINGHLRFDAATGHIEVETDPGTWKQLAGDTFFSHDPTLDSDYRSDLTPTQNSHTVSGVDDGKLVIGFEDLPFIGDVHTNKNGAITGIGNADLDYSDVLLKIDILYPDVPIVPAQWHPTTQVFSSLAQGLGALAQASYTVSGLDGDGVTLSHDGLSPGWSLTPGANVDAFGNGTYTLTPPGGVASAQAMIAELNKIAIQIPGDQGLVGRLPVEVDFAVTDTHGLSDSAAAHLNFSHGGPSPPGPSDVQVHETYVPPPTIVTLHETFG
jgi:hypothetical protein